MSKLSNLTRGEARQKLILFLKLRKGKPISEKTVSDFEKLVNEIACYNFKHYDTLEIYQEDWDKKMAAQSAIKHIKSGFIRWWNGGFSKLSDITDFGHYIDDTYKAKINGEFKVINVKDYYALKYIFFGEL